MAAFELTAETAALLAQSLEAGLPATKVPQSDRREARKVMTLLKRLAKVAGDEEIVLELPDADQY